MSDYNFSGAFEGMMLVLIIAALLAPFGIWKLIEIAIWLFNHVNITVK